VVKAILEAMTASLEKGRSNEIRGFGSFGINQRPARTGRNPKSGEKVSVPETLVPHFKPGREFTLAAMTRRWRFFSIPAAHAARTPESRRSISPLNLSGASGSCAAGTVIGNREAWDRTRP
jgi:nucleoid DNA-binding protein